MAIRRLEDVGIVVEDSGPSCWVISRSKGGWTASWGSRVSACRSPCWRPRTATDDSSSCSATPHRRGAEWRAERAAEHRGIRRLAFGVDDVDAAVAGVRARGAALLSEVVQYEDVHRICHVRGPERMVVMLAEQPG